MIKLIDLTYHAHPEFDKPIQVLQRHKGSIEYLNFLKEKIDIQVIKHLDCEGSELIDGIKYTFFNGKNKFKHIPFKTHKYIRQEKPDIVLVQGLVFPLQVIFLRLAIGRSCKIIVQHHGERPFKGIKKAIQRIADRCINAYLFTSVGNAKLWLDSNIIKHRDKCFEVLEASTYLQKQNKQESRKTLKLAGDDIFLWVGRLDAEKDPVTVLKGFEKYLLHKPYAQLYLIYQSGNLLAEINTVIHGNDLLKNAVTLIGKVPHGELETWYSAADFYVSGSHREGSGYALIEAMACGCIPVVTDIPPFRKITGEHGFLFETKSPESFYSAVLRATKVDKSQWSDNVVNYFGEHLSFKKIADDIYRICVELTTIQLQH